MKERKSVTNQLATRYQKSNKKQKGLMLDEFVQLTEYNRCYASYLLSNHNRKWFLNKTSFRIDVNNKCSKGKHKTYDDNVAVHLIRIWHIADCICSKRLKIAMPDLIESLERSGEPKLSHEIRKKLIRISPAAIDRLLEKEHAKFQLKSVHKTKPGTLLKHQIPIRTFSDWDKSIPGSVEIDLVGHDGGISTGEYIQSLDLTDIYSGWTETKAIRNKAQI